MLAIPVAPLDTIDQLSQEAGDLVVVCLSTPEPFIAVGLHHRDFDQTADEEVIDLLAQARAQSANSRPKEGGSGV